MFNELTFFHVTDNFIADVMHNLLEGVCRSSVCEMLLHFILKEMFFNLENFSFRKKMLCGETKIGNKSIDFELHQLQNSSTYWRDQYILASKLSEPQFWAV